MNSDKYVTRSPENDGRPYNSSLLAKYKILMCEYDTKLRRSLLFNAVTTEGKCCDSASIKITVYSLK